MSLTIPSSYKRSNINENWIVLLGFFNGDAQGNGEGGWDATLQADGSANLINKLGSELVQDGDNPDPRETTWTRRDKDGNADGWTVASPAAYEDDEAASMINTLTGGAVDAGLHYSLTFTVGVATLSLTIGGGDLTGNTSDETFVAKATYAVGTHTVTFTATADRSHLWFIADTASAGNGTIDDITLKINGYSSEATSIVVDDGTVFQVGDFIKIESEILKVLGISTNTLTVARGAMSTTAATHNNNTAIYWNNFTPIALSDTTVDDVFYHGAITSKPTIRESINILDSTSKTGNVSLTVANFQFKGDDFSAEIFNGSRAYVNRTCKIYSQPDDASNLSDCLLIYTGRLTDFSHNHESVKLRIAAQRPWDDVEIPQTKTSKNNYFPVAYGNFTPNSAAVSFSTSSDDDDFRNRKTLYPVPLEEHRGDTLYALTGEWSQSSNAFPHIYEKKIDKFIPLANHATTYTTVDTANEAYGDGYAILFHQNLLRKIVTKLQERTSSGTGWATNNNAFNSTTVDTSTYTQFDMPAEFTDGTTYDIKFKMPQLIGFTSLLQFHYIIAGTCTLTAESGSGEIRIQLIDNTFSNAQTLGYFQFTVAATSTTLKETTSGNLSISSAALASSTSDRDTVFLSSSGGWGEDFVVRMKAHLQSGNLDGELEGHLRLYDVMIETVAQLDFANTSNGGTKTGAYKILEDIDYLYCGGDGLPDNGWNSSAAITEIHEAHRDLLQRFTTFVDSAGTAYGSANHPTNWSSGTNINSIKDWGIRYWVNEPQLLIDCLEELQYNGGFIGRFNGQGNYQYVFIPDSITADFTLTKADIADINIDLTSFSNIVTSMDIEYEKHPAQGYVSEVNATNSSSITAYNIQSTENKKKVSLSALVSAPASSAASNPNDDWYTYYDNLVGTVKHIVKATVVNPFYYGIDVGDFIQFSDLEIDPFGSTWTDKDFIVENLQRSQGTLKIQAREVS